MTIYNSLSESNGVIRDSLPLNFSYSKVSYSEFKNEFVKVDDKTISCSHPLANIVKAVARIAPVIFFTLMSPLIGLNRVKFHAFTLVRELEEAAGFVAAKFNLSFGAFLVQEAQFHIQAYSECVQSNIRFSALINQIPNKTFEEFEVRDVLRYQTDDFEFIRKYVKKPNLANSEYEIDLFSWSFAKFCHADGNEIAKLFNSSSYFLFDSLSNLQKNQIDYEALESFRIQYFLEDYPKRLNELNPVQIVSVLNKFPDYAKHIENEELVKKIDFNKLSRKALVRLISNDKFADTFNEDNLKSRLDDLIVKYDQIRNEKVKNILVNRIHKKGLKNFDPDTITKILKNIRLLYDLNIDEIQSIVKAKFDYIPFNLLKKLNLDEITFNQFKDTISINYLSNKYWGLMPLSTVLANIESIPVNAWTFISKEIIEKIDFSTVSLNVLESLANIVPVPLLQSKLEQFSEEFFRNLEVSKIDQLDFNHVSSQTIKKIPLDKRPISLLQQRIKQLSNEEWNALSEARINLLDFTGFNKDDFIGLPNRVIPLINPDQMDAIVPRLSEDQCDMLAPKQVWKINFEAASDFIINRVLKNRYSLEKKGFEVFAGIPHRHLLKILNCMPTYTIGWFSLSQCRSLISKDINADLLNSILMIYGSKESLFEGVDINDYVFKMEPIQIKCLHSNLKSKIDRNKLNKDQKEYYDRS